MIWRRPSKLFSLNYSVYTIIYLTILRSCKQFVNTLNVTHQNLARFLSLHKYIYKNNSKNILNIKWNVVGIRIHFMVAWWEVVVGRSHQWSDVWKCRILTVVVYSRMGDHLDSLWRYLHHINRSVPTVGRRQTESPCCRVSKNQCS